MENIVSAPKTDMFRFRINPEIKKTGRGCLCEKWPDADTGSEYLHPAVH